jgi:phosphoglucomutase
METATILDAARVGFASLKVSPSTQELALSHLGIWLEDPRFIMYNAQIVAMVNQQRWLTLIDCFYRVLPFGTGGRRGRVGIGPNCFNPWTLSTSIQGHAMWLRQSRGEGGLSVVIGYDVRQFSDIGRVLESGIHSPVDGITSRNFAEIAAEIYAAQDITVYLPPEGAFLSTPELSFAVRELEADGGLVISASHNPPDDNGSKFYHHHGGQLVPPFDEEMEHCVTDVQRVERMSMDRAVANGLVREIPTSVHAAYIQANLNISRMPQIRSTAVVFTPLHGTGDTTVAEVLSAAGFSCTIEPTQATHDGSFPTVPFRCPNPERASTLDAAIETAKRNGATLVMACDPDADRLGVGVLHQGDWKVLHGNDIAALVCYAALHQHPHNEPLVMKTEVTSSLISRIAESMGAQVIDDLLVGFKYIGEALFLLERKGRFRAIEGSPERFAAGLEESHGVLVQTNVRDKDAAGGALLLAELASQEGAEKRTLVDTLHDLMLQHGVFHTHTSNTVMTGAVGRGLIDDAMASFRKDPPTSIAGREVLSWSDRQDPDGVLGPIRSKTDHASRNMLVFLLDRGSRVVLRPSGTEPKAKIYSEAMGSADSFEDVRTVREHVGNEARILAAAFTQEMLSRIDIHLPNWALDISDLVSIQDKQEWALELVPALLAQVAEKPDEASIWLTERLDAEARALLFPGVVTLAAHWGGDSAALLACFES